MDVAGDDRGGLGDRKGRHAWLLYKKHHLSCRAYSLPTTLPAKPPHLTLGLPDIFFLIQGLV